jgi:very-short-patch-repair endonuclease
VKHRARALRQNMTDAETLIWYQLKDRQLNGFKFLRQYIIGKYIVDFVCRQKKLIIELDGSQHAENMLYDEQRTQFLNSLGYRVLRFWNNDVFENMEGILEEILEKIE